METKVELQPEIKSIQVNDTNKKKIRWTIFLAAFSANMFMLVAGLVESYTSPAAVDMTKLGSRFMDVTPDQITWIASLPVLSIAVGGIISGYISPACGRRAMLILISPLYVLGWLAIAYAPTISFIYAGRLVCGFSYAMSVIAVPAYTTEISPVRIRGLLGTVIQFSYSIGYFIMILLAYVLRWSWLAVPGAAFVTLGACLMFFMPESPEWLLRNSRRTEAIQSLRFLHGKHLDLEKEIEFITQNINTQPKTKFNWREFLEPTFYKPLLISLTMVSITKFVGINIIMTYTVQIFQSTGSIIDPQSSTVLFAAVNILATLVASLLADRAGRRTLYIISGSCVTISLVMLGLYDFFDQKGHELSSWHWVPLVSLLMYIGFYSVGIGPMVMTMIPEMVPITSRSTILSAAITWSALLGFILTKLFAFMVDNMKFYGMFWTFGVFSVFATAFGIFGLPETKGRTVKDINNSFRSKSIKY